MNVSFLYNFKKITVYVYMKTVNKLVINIQNMETVINIFLNIQNVKTVNNLVINIQKLEW